MKILHVVGPARFGGIERLVLDLASSQMRRKDADIGVLFTIGEGEFLEKYVKAGLRCHSANLASGYDFSPRKFRNAKSICRRYDVIHMHSFNPLLAMSAVASDRPIVYTEHGNFGFGRKIGTLEKVKAWLLKKFLNAYVSHITFNSRFTAGVAEMRYGLSNVSRSVVYNGVAIETIQAHVDGLENSMQQMLHGKFIIGTASRFAGFKRVDRLVRAFSIFRRGKNDVSLLLVGDGALRQSLEGLVEKEGVSESTIFAGYRANVYDFLDAMHVCVFPSEGEPFGLAAVEALLLGKPVIIFRDGGGLVEVVSGISSTDVVNDEHELAARFDHYYERKDELGRQAPIQRAYGARYGIEQVTEKFQEIYVQALKCAA